MYPFGPSNGRQREILEVLRKKLAGKIPLNKIQPGTLRAFGKLKNNTGSVKFDFDSRQPVMSGEALLNDGRLFVGNVMSLGIAQVPVTDGNLHPAAMKLISFPHPGLFSAAQPGVSASFGSSAVPENSGQSVIDSVRAYFNGLLSLTVDQDVLIEKYPASNFMHCKDQSGVVNLGTAPIDLHTTLVLNGGKTNIVNVEFPLGTSDRIEGTETQRNFGVIELHGFVIATGTGTMRDDIAKYLFS